MANLESFEGKMLGNELKCCFRTKQKQITHPYICPIKLMYSCQWSKLKNRKKIHPYFTAQRKLLGF